MKVKLVDINTSRTIFEANAKDLSDEAHITCLYLLNNLTPKYPKQKGVFIPYEATLYVMEE